MKFARRLQQISASPTMAVMQEAKRLQAEGIDVIDFGPGEPDFPTPDPVKAAGIAAIEANFTKYTAGLGISELRKAVADRYNRQWDTHFSEQNVAICNGAKHAIFNVCMALFQEGDEVIIPAPYWVSFPEVVKMTGATPRIAKTEASRGFVLQPAYIRRALTEQTRGLIINSPNNPTGAVLPSSVVEDLTLLSRDRNLVLLYDETYDYFTYGPDPHVSIASFLQPEDEFFAIVGSMSKTYSMTGWRIGYCVAHEDLIRKIGQFQSHQSGNPSSISQKAALCALQGDESLIRTMKEEYSRRRTYILDRLSRIAGIECPPPFGAFYVFPNISGCLGSPGLADSSDFARFLIKEARVATVPGSAFGMEGYIRISYATSMEKIEEGLNRIERAVASLASQPQRA